MATASTLRESLRRRLRMPAMVLLALIGLDLVVRSQSDVWERHSPDDYAERVRGCAAQPQDFVLVGGSPVSEGLDPDVIAGGYWNGRTLDPGYAVGLPGGTTSEVYHAVLRACPTPPRLLIYGITASDINDGRYEPHGPYSLMTWGDLGTWLKHRPDATEWALRHFTQARLSQSWALFRYRHGIRMWAALTAEKWLPGCFPASVREARESADYAAALRAGHGYAPAAGFAHQRYDIVKAVQAEVPPFAFLDKYRTGAHLTYLHRLLDWAEQHQTTVILLDMPVTADLEAKYASALAEYRERLTEVEAQRGVRVIRASRDAVELDDTHFSDLIHLNRNGARKLSEWVRERLAEGGRP